jgi:hypothetical protein
MHNDVERADLMIDRLSDLLRMSLRTDAQQVTVKEELELLQKYLEIEQTRFRDRLAISIDVNGDVLDATCRTSCCSRSSRTRCCTGSRPRHGRAASRSAPSGTAGI